MRVIAGSARRLKLLTVEGNDVRPTTDRIKETLFNMLQFDLEGAAFLDLFAGSGGIGIEALSRGAKKAVFVDQSRKSCDVIQKNLDFTRLADRGEILKRDVFTAISLLEGRGETFDFIFMDPPYGKGIESDVLLRLEVSPLVRENTLLIAESDLAADYDRLEGSDLYVVKEKRYKTNMHTFFRKSFL